MPGRSNGRLAFVATATVLPVNDPRSSSTEAEEEDPGDEREDRFQPIRIGPSPAGQLPHRVDPTERQGRGEKVRQRSCPTLEAEQSRRGE